MMIVNRYWVQRGSITQYVHIIYAFLIMTMQNWNPLFKRTHILTVYKRLYFWTKFASFNC